MNKNKKFVAILAVSTAVVSAATVLFLCARSKSKNNEPIEVSEMQFGDPDVVSSDAFNYNLMAKDTCVISGINEEVIGDLDLPVERDGYYVTGILPGVFEDTGVVNLTVPSNYLVGISAFANCKSLKTVEAIGVCTMFSDSSFENCISLETADVSANDICLGAYMFSGCTSLREVKFGNGLEEIYSKTFENCTSLKEIDIPNSVNMIAKDAFEGCSITLIVGNDSYAMQYAKKYGIPYTVRE